MTATILVLAVLAAVWLIRRARTRRTWAQLPGTRFRLDPRHRRILGYLAAHGEATGVQISRGGRVWIGNLYPALLQLEGAELVESRWAPLGILGHPRQRYYRLTTSGVDFAHEHKTEEQ